jgi:hypothetical protein
VTRVCAPISAIWQTTRHPELRGLHGAVSLGFPKRPGAASSPSPPRSPRPPPMPVRSRVGCCGEGSQRLSKQGAESRDQVSTKVPALLDAAGSALRSGRQSPPRSRNRAADWADRPPLPPCGSACRRVACCTLTVAHESDLAHSCDIRLIYQAFIRKVLISSVSG